MANSRTESEQHLEPASGTYDQSRQRQWPYAEMGFHSGRRCFRYAYRGWRRSVLPRLGRESVRGEEEQRRTDLVSQDFRIRWRRGSNLSREPGRGWERGNYWRHSELQAGAPRRERDLRGSRNRNTPVDDSG